MGYITYDYYVQIYGSEQLSSSEFPAVSLQVFRVMDKYTTGIDNVKKLRVAFPTDEYDAEAVKQCAARLVNIATQIAIAEKAANNRYTQTANGLQGKVISSISAGNESITYATNTTAATIVEKAAADKNEQNRLYRDTIRDYLSGVTDANGVNLLYMGRYPFDV